MKRRGFVGLFAALLARAQEGVQPAAPAAPVGYTIAGVVVNAVTNAPLNKVLVTIASTVNRQESREVVTGSDGRFAFTNLPAFKFALTVARSSGQPQAYLAHGNFSSAIVTGPNQDTANITFRFHLPGAIAGTVLDENNEPVRNGTVHLFTRFIDENGMRRLMTTRTDVTKSSGRFRMAHLSPGSYLLAVSALPWFAQQNFGRGPGMNYMGPADNRPAAPPDTQFDVTYPMTYYPNALDPSGAGAITVQEGSDAAVQVTLRAVPAIHVRLQAETKAGAGVNVQLAAIGPEGRPVPLNVAASLQSGQGELNGIAAGRYQLTISSFAMPTPMRRAAGLAEPEELQAERPGFTRRVVDLVDGGVVDLTAGSRTSVRAIVKTATGDHPSNRIGLFLRDTRTGSGASAMAAPDGTLKFPEASLYPGRYNLMLSNTPAFHIVSVEAKGGKVSGTELVVDENADIQLTVTIDRRSNTNIEGFAVRDDAAVVGAMVLLLPRSPKPGSPTYQDQSDSDGSFAFRGVAAGSYLAVAIDDGRELAFGEPNAMTPYLAGALAITVSGAAASAALKIPVQQRQPYSG